MSGIYKDRTPQHELNAVTDHLRSLAVFANRGISVPEQVITGLADRLKSVADTLGEQPVPTTKETA